jgi:hypothetical protein
MTTPSTVTVRMYHVGFGDAFLVTVRNDEARWRMLIDCGVHNSGRVRPLEDVVDAVIADLADANGEATIDVVVGTHRHADHIAGFALPVWDKVKVDGVWLPWVEDLSDPEAVDLQRELEDVATALVGFSGQALALSGRRDIRISSTMWEIVGLLAANASPGDAALERLRGETDGFVAPDAVRYLSNDGDEDTVVATPFPDVKVHVLGPSRNRDVLKKMNPPKSAEWLSQLAVVAATGPARDSPKRLFDARYEMPEEMLATPEFKALESQMGFTSRLHQVGDDEALLAASKLEDWCNNTSLFIVLEVGERRLVFPGDTQEGGWRHVMDRDTTMPIVRNADFYKVSHHGSHNGTPQRFVNDVLGDDHSLMLPFSPVSQWKKIPVKGLISSFTEHGHRIACADAEYRTDQKATLGPGELWSEITL